MKKKIFLLSNSMFLYIENQQKHIWNPVQQPFRVLLVRQMNRFVQKYSYIVWHINNFFPVYSSFFEIDFASLSSTLFNFFTIFFIRVIWSSNFALDFSKVLIRIHHFTQCSPFLTLILLHSIEFQLLLLSIIFYQVSELLSDSAVRVAWR